MNPQPDNYSVQVATFLFVLLCVVQYFRHKPSAIKNYDMFEIGTITPTDLPVRVVERKVMVKPPKRQLTQLQQDCVDVLHALGMKKSDALKMMKTVFTTSNPKDIHEFLTIAMKK